ncbi:MAG: hypothetical protein GY950_30935 [bacterium]|nr:hypothetical protein [bacterium]
MLLLLSSVIHFPAPGMGNEKKDFPTIKGPYLGQKPPGMVPEVFAPGIISTGKNELNAVFSPKGDEFFFCVSDRKYIIMYTKQVNGTWIKPQVAPFSGKYSDVDMAYSPDGNRLYFCSSRPAPWSSNPGDDVWYCQRLKDGGWSKPKNLGIPLNSPGNETYPSFAANGNMYVASSRRGGKGSKDVYCAKFINGKFSKPVNLGDAINTMYGEGDTFIAPDESYLIVSSWGRPDDTGRGDLYISFKTKDGNWGKAKNMGKPINTRVIEYCPMLSPDGKYLFFTRGGDIYWVDAKIIDKYRPKELK